MGHHGNLIYGSETVGRVENNGFVSLNGTKVTEFLQVNGRLKVEDAQIEEMPVNGQANLDRSNGKDFCINHSSCSALFSFDRPSGFIFFNPRLFSAHSAVF